MQSRCVVLGCRVGYENGPTTYSMHSFPRNQKLAKKWFSKINRKDYSASGDSKVCGWHFEDNCFLKTNTKARLRHGAVPTLYMRGYTADITPIPSPDHSYIATCKNQPFQHVQKKRKRIQEIQENWKRLRSQEIQNNELKVDGADKQSKHEKSIHPASRHKSRIAEKSVTFSVTIHKESAAKKVLHILHGFQRTGDFCDVTLVSSDGDEFVAHAGVIAAASTLLKEKMEACYRGNYTVGTAFSGQEIRAFIDYAYTGNTNDPLLLGLTDLGLLCHLSDSPKHAREVLSLLHNFAIKALFCNMAFPTILGDVQPSHSYLLTAKYNFLSTHIKQHSILSIQFSDAVNKKLQNDVFADIYCAPSIMRIEPPRDSSNKREIKMSTESDSKNILLGNKSSQAQMTLDESRLHPCFICNKMLTAIQLKRKNRPFMICAACDKMFKSHLEKHSH